MVHPPPSPDLEPQSPFRVTVENPHEIFSELFLGTDGERYTFLGEVSLDNAPIEEVIVRTMSDRSHYQLNTRVKVYDDYHIKNSSSGDKRIWKGDYTEVLSKLMNSPLSNKYGLKLLGNTIYIVNQDGRQQYAIEAKEHSNHFAIISGEGSTSENNLTNPQEFERSMQSYADVIQKTVESIYGVLGLPSPDSELIIRPSRKVRDALGRGENGSGAGGLASLFGSLDPKEALRREIVVEDRPDISFDDVGGQAGAKKELMGISFALTNPGIYQEWGTRPPKGIMLFGPPGTGKSLMVKALASEANATFIHASISQLTSMWHGEGEKKVKNVFEIARESKRAVIFIDEVDAFGSRETASEPAIRMLNTLLEEMDGMSSGDNFIVVCATNRPDALDPAFKRAGRIDKWVELPLPDIEGLKQIFSIHIKAAEALAERKLFEDMDIERMATEAERLKFSGADVAEIVRRSLEEKVREEAATGNRPVKVGMDELLISLSSYERIKKAKDSIGFGFK